MPKKQRKIDIEYKEMSSLSDEEISEKLKQNENVDKEIAGKEEYLQTLEDGEQKEKLEKEIAGLKKKSDQLKGYAKNKDKIEKVKEVKGKFEKLMQSNINKKDTLKADLEVKSNELKEILKEQENLSKMKTEDMTNDEYNRLFSIEKEKEEKAREVKAIREQMKELDQKVANQKATISKCDLVWKNLFYNRDWDEIHVKALNMREYKGKNTDIIKEARKEGQKEQSQDLFRIEPEIEEDKQLLDDKFAQKHPWLAKVRNLFRKVKEKVQTQFRKDDVEEEIEPEEVETTKTRDTFVEELRKMTEKGVRENIAEAEKEKYKNNVKQQDDKEDEIEL